MTLALLLVGSFSATSAAGERCPVDFETSPCLGKMIEKIRARGWVGIHLATPKRGTWVVRAIVPGSPAESAGLRAGDQLVALDGVPYTKRRMQDLERIYDAMQPGRDVTYTVDRGGDEVEITLELAEIPEHIIAEWVGRAVLESYGAQHASRAPEAPRPPKRPPQPKRPPAGGGLP
ncbi:MAG: PDZ domain-containing protein [Acidobacteriota bacterium]